MRDAPVPADDDRSGDLLALRTFGRYERMGEHAMRASRFVLAGLAFACVGACGGEVALERADSGARTQEAGLAPDDSAPVVDAAHTWPDGECFPDLSGCSEGTQCCSGVCVGGQCGASGRDCLPDGLGCQHAAQCCSLACSATCGGVTMDAGEPDVSASDGSSSSVCTFGTTFCDACLNTECCTEIEACQGDAVCASQLQCLVTCERNGGSGFACAAGLCSKPSDQATTNLFTCGSQKCFSPCYSG